MNKFSVHRFNRVGQAQAATLTPQGRLQADEINFQGSTQSALVQFDVQNKAAEITKQSSLEALYKRNMSSFVQTVGNSAEHQISELFERASKGM